MMSLVESSNPDILCLDGDVQNRHVGVQVATIQDEALAFGKLLLLPNSNAQEFPLILKLHHRRS